MSDYHEMYENWGELIRDYDPDYPIDDGKQDDENNKPVSPDAWADNDFDGG